MRVSDALRVPSGPVDLSAIDARATPAFKGRGKADALRSRTKIAQRLATRQEQLYAEARVGGRRSVLLVLQGMDTSGKGGTIRHVVAGLDPSGVEVTAFREPTPEELEHDFLWRIRRRLPEPGILGVFDRSQYEDVVTARVRGLVDTATVLQRIAAINRFEEEVAAGGMRVIKCFLHISRDEQRTRLLARLDDPTKHWKFSPGDLEDRARWDEYMAAYASALERCNAGIAPWYVVPADRKWYRNWAVARLLREHLDDLAPHWPHPTYDVEEQRRRLLELP